MTVAEPYYWTNIKQTTQPTPSSVRLSRFLANEPLTAEEHLTGGVALASPILPTYLTNSPYHESLASLSETAITPVLSQLTSSPINLAGTANVTLGLNGSPTYNPASSKLNTYLWEDVNHIIPSNNLYDRLKEYEVKYAMSSEEFYTKWIHGSIVDSPETNDWINLYIMFHNP